jgi:hypothetical protein
MTQPDFADVNLLPTKNGLDFGVHYTEIREEAHGFLPPFTVLDGYLYTFADLVDQRSPLREHCDASQIGVISAERWANDETPYSEYVFLLNQLLGCHLRRCGLVYNRDFKREYFPRQNDTDSIFKEDWYNVRTARAAPPRTVARHYQYGFIRFWRHLALNLAFKRMGTSWFLQIVPKYLFTEDGEIPCPREVVGPYTTGIKAVERNLHVLNHILFWVDVISMRQPVIRFSLYHKTLMVIEKAPYSGIASFAIPSDPAVYDVDESQLDFFTAISREEDQEEQTDEYYA